MFALEISRQDTKGFLDRKEITEGWCNALIKNSKVRREESRMPWGDGTLAMDTPALLLMGQM